MSPFGASLLDFGFKISKKKFTLGVYNELEAEILRIVRNTTDLIRLNFHVRHLFQGSLIRELRYIEWCFCKICGRNLDVFVKFDNTCYLLSSDFDVEKDTSKKDCCIHKTSLTILSCRRSWQLGYNLFIDLYHLI